MYNLRLTNEAGQRANAGLFFAVMMWNVTVINLQSSGRIRLQRANFLSLSRESYRLEYFRALYNLFLIEFHCGHYNSDFLCKRNYIHLSM